MGFAPRPTHTSPFAGAAVFRLRVSLPEMPTAARTEENMGQPFLLLLDQEL